MKKYNRNLGWLFNTFAIVSLILAILKTFDLPPFQTIFGAFLIAVLLILAVIAAGHVVEWLTSRPRVKYCRSLEDAPQYEIRNILNSIRDGKRKKMEVIARTSFRLLGGDEEEYRKNRADFEWKQSELQSIYCKSLKNGGEIHFVLQNPNVTVPSFADELNKLLLLKEQTQVAIESCKTISSKLIDSNAEGKISSSITDTVISNSMVRLTTNRDKIILIRDLSIEFKKPSNDDITSEREVEKPFLIFKGEGEESREFREEFDDILKHSESIGKFELERENGLQEVEEHIRTHSHYYSRLRRDQSGYLAASAAYCFMAEHDSKKFVPPMCVHFMITNSCTTKCLMCDHYKLSNGKTELSFTEVKNVLKCIQDIGAKRIILSGGEPLAREDLFDILKYAKECDLELGLITNGVCSAGRSVNDYQAKIIADTCSWVQLSIDSFKRETYQTIRGGDYLHIAINSLKQIQRCMKEKGKKESLEVCFTIQKDNIKQISELKQSVKDFDIDVPVRLKFAHGPENGRNFLFTKDELELAIRQLQELREDRQFNAKYLLNMIRMGYFTKDVLCNGTPLREKMKEYKRKGYICRILSLNCVINANGDVYPCCFLFDDNHAQSRFRDSYHRPSNSLRGEAGVNPPSEGENKLAEIWYKDTLFNSLRKDQLPVDPEACSYCTRYFYQNELLNEVYDTFKRYENYGVVEEFIKKRAAQDLNEAYWI